MSQNTKLTIQDLRRLGNESNGHALIALYLNARAPSSVGELEGNPLGKGLCLHLESRFSMKALIAPWVFKWTEKESFPWHGKSFRSISANEGYGFNRWSFWGLEGFPFTTKIGSSVLDGKDCLQIDYSLAVNPKAQKSGYDEIREVSPGIFLGVVFSNKQKHKIVCWFGVDCNQQMEFPPLLKASD